MELLISFVLLTTVFAGAMLFLTCAGVENSETGFFMTSMMSVFSLIPITFGVLVVLKAVLNKEDVLPMILGFGSKE